MKLIFGLEFDDLVAPRPAASEGGSHYCGRKGLLQLLEAHLGLVGHADDIEYLRIEQYRQAVRQLAVGSEQLAVGGDQSPVTNHQSPVTNQPFFQKSFEADQFATAADLLSRRDELKLAGWDFLAHENCPPRLATLAEIEAIFDKKEALEAEETPLVLTPGYADRFVEVLKMLDVRLHPFTEIWLHEPLELLPCHFQRLFKKMANSAAKPPLQKLPDFSEKANPKENPTDLQSFQSRLLATHSSLIPHPSSLKSDGSLFLIPAKRSNEAASWLAKLLRLNPDFRPTLLIPEKNRTLDIALIQEGLPSLGIQSASLARPTLQILKLVTAFLWEPIDPFKILEFVSLSIKPLADDLATAIANQVAQTPGLKGDGWYTMLNRYFDALDEKAANDPNIKPTEVRRYYNFWFERQRYDMDKTAPKDEVIEIFNFIKEWSFKAFDEGNGKNHSLIVLSEQSKRIVELLYALPETQLTFLELERIVRTIYEPAPVVFQEREVGHLPFVTHPGAFAGAMDDVVWWNFVQNDQPHFFSRWYQNERQFLDNQNITLDLPQQENARMLWQQVRPLLSANKRLFLILPERVDGEEVLPHPLFGDLQAAFGNLDGITCPIFETEICLSKYFDLPKRVPLEVRRLGKPKPFLNIRQMEKLAREYETLTSLEALFYYPYQWMFKYKIKLNKSSILSVVGDNTLMGNLSHRVFEKLLKEDLHALDKLALEGWIDTEARRLLSREGAVLLMYGREPDRVAFLNKLKFAAWSLISHIRDNGWQVVQTEKELTGFFPKEENGGIEVRGIADLVLQRGDELAVVDIKWRGSSRRESVIKNEEDLQLVLYSRLLAPEGQWAHTSYFIIENGKLIARNNLAFKKITPLTPEGSHEAINQKILTCMEATWQWRMAQLAKGQIEIRCRQTLSEIEEQYSADGQGQLMLEILEMRSEDARWDDFRTLINLVD